jgi:ADP-heptose:LPS heptosyltransferase
VLAHEALRRAALRVGAENVYFLVLEENRPIVDELRVVPRENVLTIRGGGLVRFAADALRAVVRLRALRVDASIDMEFFSRASAILAFLSGAHVRVGLHRFRDEAPYRGDLLTHRLLYNHLLHTTWAYASLVDALDADPARTPMLQAPAPRVRGALPAVEPTDAERKAVRRLVHEALGRAIDGPLVLLNPNAGDLMPLRRWPRERFVALARRLLDETPGAAVLVTGAPAEREAADALAREIGSLRAASVAGRTSFRDLLVLYTLADVLVTNDSGPAHFASLAPIHTVVLFGPGSAKLYGPLGPRALPIAADLACSPCLHVYNHRSSPCREAVCMSAIDVERVLGEVRACLARRGAPELDRDGAHVG